MKTLKLFLLLVALTVLAGCTTSPQPLQPQSREGKVLAAATLAMVGTCEVDVAADYTALVLSRQRAARDLRAKTISVDTAIQVQALADAARADLEAACPNRAATLDVRRRDAARATLASISKLLEKKP